VSLATARNKGYLSNRIVANDRYHLLTNNVYINVSKPRTVRTKYVWRPVLEDTRYAAVSEEFLKKFGYKLREIFCISNIHGYPENIVIYQDITGYTYSPLVVDGTHLDQKAE
jgi:hypothetical protein